MADNQLQQLIAASALIVTLEKICTRGLLSESEEADARRLIVRAGRAFQLDTVAERPLESSSVVEREAVNFDVAGSSPASPANYDEMLQVVDLEMGRTG